MLPKGFIFVLLQKGVMNYNNKIKSFYHSILDELYPIRLGKIGLKDKNKENIKFELEDLLDYGVEDFSSDHIKLIEDFIYELPNIKAALDKDILATYDGDPAAVNYNEVILTYPGFYAIAAYRIANFLLKQGVPLIPRAMTEFAKTKTGIDIHPGAEIGASLCIDHGTGVVIGQTAIIGNHVKIYQGVTLGAMSITKKDMKGKRHPTIEDHVIIYAQATILGGETTIGKNSIIGGNVWITKSVAPNSKVYYRDNDNTLSLTNELIRDEN